ncbi:hypothetical protein KKG63_00190 [Patescibacteria group bacterium]|nr:hypothetical protein [Patescibacteria group bacterium]
MARKKARRMEEVVNNLAELNIKTKTSKNRPKRYQEGKEREEKKIDNRQANINKTKMRTINKRLNAWLKNDKRLLTKLLKIIPTNKIS